MTLAEAEALAREVLAADIDTAHDGWCRDERVNLARILLAVLPVVKAAEAHAAYSTKYIKPPGDWACVECVPHSDMIDAEFRCTHHGLLNALSHLHATTTEGT